MPTKHTLTGSFADLLGISIAGARLKVTLGTNLGREALSDLDNDEVLPPYPIPVPLTGASFSLDLIATNSTGINVLDGTLRYIVYVEYRDASNEKRKWNSGFFELTANTDLSDIVTATYLPPTFASQTIAEMEALLAQAEEITGLSGEDEAVALLVNTPGSDTAEALAGFIANDGETVLPDPTALTSWGDSLTASTGVNWPATTLADYTGLTVVNAGVSGQAAAEILLRMGAYRPRLTLSGNEIPASGAVTVTTVDPASGWRRTGGTGSFSFTGTLAGVPGTFTNSFTGNVNTFTFTRTTAGSAVTVPPGTPFVVDDSYRHPLDRAVVWAGRNNAGDGNPGTSSLDVADELLRLVPNGLDAQSKQFLIIGTLNGTNEIEGGTVYGRVVASNARRAAAFGDRFLDIRRDFIDRGLEIAGVNPTPADEFNIANDAPPPSLMEALPGTIHPNADGYEVVAYLVAEKIGEMGWAEVTLPPLPTPTGPVTVRTTYTSDSFNRADTAAGTLGTTDAALGGTAQAWDAETGLCVVSNQIGLLTPQAIRSARMSVGSADHGAKAKVTAQPVGQRIVCRFADLSNCFQLVRRSNGNLILNAIVGGVTTSLTEITSPVVVVGDTIALEVQGNEARAYVNDTPVIVRDISSFAGSLGANTKTGWASALNDATVRADDIVLYTITTA